MSHFINESTKWQMNGYECLWALIANNCVTIQATNQKVYLYQHDVSLLADKKNSQSLANWLVSWVRVQKHLGCCSVAHSDLWPRTCRESGFKGVAYLIISLMILFLLCKIQSPFMRLVSVRVYNIYGLALTYFLSKFLVFKVWQRDKKYFATSAQTCPFPELPLYFLALTLADW